MEEYPKNETWQENFRRWGIEIKTEHKEPFLNRAKRRKYGLKGINVPKTQADELKEVAVMQRLKDENN